MFWRLFGSRRNANTEICDTVYGQIVAAARQPSLYEGEGAPDTPLGRFEMIGLHMFLLLHRLRGANEELSGLGQELTDTFFTELDHSLRELGISDPGMPKRMKKLARMYYGRIGSYGEALDADDAVALAEALKRNIRPGDSAWPKAATLARYVMAARDRLAALTDAELASGNVAFPEAGSFLSGERHNA